ncbi:pectinesterase inhibitor-like [Melia azedarach]|uniref:Pectinesterase inhibitor-like n=1 Tax=Melia azedarach TaxID=155640 RepID=A0ACC1YWB8_MELAZ|nr:pectinesterase inhibitor-like [Melia azedarach]
MAFNKAIIFVIALSSLLALSNVEATSRSPVEEVDPAPAVESTSRILAEAEAPSAFRLEDFCFHTEFPSECVSTTRPLINGHINAFTILDAGLKALAERTQKATVDVEKLRKKDKKSEKSKELAVCIAYYNIVSNSIKRAQAAIPAKDFDNLEYELDYQVSSIRNCETLVAGSELGQSDSPMDELNLSLTMVAKNNLGIGNNLMNPERP